MTRRTLHISSDLICCDIATLSPSLLRYPPHRAPLHPYPPFPHVPMRSPTPLHCQLRRGMHVIVVGMHVIVVGMHVIVVGMHVIVVGMHVIVVGMHVVGMHVIVVAVNNNKCSITPQQQRKLFLESVTIMLIISHDIICNVPDKGYP